MQKLNKTWCNTMAGSFGCTHTWGGAGGGAFHGWTLFVHPQCYFL